MTRRWRERLFFSILLLMMFVDSVCCLSSKGQFIVKVSSLGPSDAVSKQ